MQWLEAITAEQSFTIVGSMLAGVGGAVMIVAAIRSPWLDYLRGNWTWDEDSGGRPVGRVAIFCIGLSIAIFGAFAIAVPFDVLSNRYKTSVFLLFAIAPVFIGSFWEFAAAKRQPDAAFRSKCESCGQVLEFRVLHPKCPRCGRKLN